MVSIGEVEAKDALTLTLALLTLTPTDAVCTRGANRRGED
jgi:hypothetical protein|tara:strand:- start:14283 stop:14402 length:120 start_codon:yes stop_codon:yes gene_type:complete